MKRPVEPVLQRLRDVPNKTTRYKAVLVVKKRRSPRTGDPKAAKLTEAEALFSRSA